MAECLRGADDLADRASRFTDLDHHGQDAAANLGTNGHNCDGGAHGDQLAIAGYAHGTPDRQANSDTPSLVFGRFSRRGVYCPGWART